MLRNCLRERGGALSGGSEDKVLGSETLESELLDDEELLLPEGPRGVEEAWGRRVAGVSF